MTSSLGHPAQGILSPPDPPVTPPGNPGTAAGSVMAPPICNENKLDIHCTRTSWSSLSFLSQLWAKTQDKHNLISSK